MHLTLHRHGVVPYREALALQERAWQRTVEESVGGQVLLLQHPPVITFGRRERGAGLKAPRAAIEAEGIDIVEIGRGGLATYHGPGQLVCYPVINLRLLQLRVRDLVRHLERTAAATCNHFGVRTLDSCAADLPVGVWVEPTQKMAATPPARKAFHKKIGQIGLQVRRGVCMHGLALNVCNDLRPFDRIEPCGLSWAQPTSLLSELQQRAASNDTPAAQLPTFEQVTDRFAALLATALGVSWLPA